jgi:hypothetical protein
MYQPGDQVHVQRFGYFQEDSIYTATVVRTTKTMVVLTESAPDAPSHYNLRDGRGVGNRGYRIITAREVAAQAERRAENAKRAEAGKLLEQMTGYVGNSRARQVLVLKLRKLVDQLEAIDGPWAPRKTDQIVELRSRRTLWYKRSQHADEWAKLAATAVA